MVLNRTAIQQTKLAMRQHRICGVQGDLCERKQVAQVKVLSHQTQCQSLEQSGWMVLPQQCLSKDDID
jgi:hypothetical protein